MRQIWRPLGPFLDLLFCNCEGYMTAAEHSFAEYMQWVRDNQMDSAIFYNTTGVTVRDQKYLASFERAQRSGVEPQEPAERDARLAMHTMTYPEDDARETRGLYRQKTVALAFEALNVLHKLADYYPPEWMTGEIGDPALENEGHRLIRVTRDILLDWDPILKGLEQAVSADPNSWQDLIVTNYTQPLDWHNTGSDHVAGLDAATPTPDPAFDLAQVQDGILRSHGPVGTTIRHGALMLFTVRKTDKARTFIARLMQDQLIRFADGAGQGANPTLFANIVLTPQGLMEMGMFRQTLEMFPTEFREGLAERSGLVGDMRENHPRNWILPDRNGPAFCDPESAQPKFPPVEMGEIDFVFQLRSTDADPKILEDAALRIARDAAPGATLEAIEMLHIKSDAETGRFRDHFGFVDGISQPKPRIPDETPSGLARDRVALGEVVLGYRNDRDDGPPTLFDTLDGTDRPDEMRTTWRNRYRAKAQRFQKDGSYLVIRKIGEDVSAFEGWLDSSKSSVAAQIGCTEDEARARLKAAIMGRRADGAPLVPPGETDNDFDYTGDKSGLACPHAAHIRRANPRRTSSDRAAPAEVRMEFERPTPRLVRRGMLFGNDGDRSRGLMFMAYAASIAEQYEVIQRWLNGGNPTDIASANNDPLTGVQPKDGRGTFRFVVDRHNAGTGLPEKVVVRAPLPPINHGDGNTAEPERHPFAPLYWGLYLFAPSRSALETMTRVWEGGYRPLGEFLEQAVGDDQIGRLGQLAVDVRGREWKRLLEDFMTKDPSERDISPHVWSAIRYYAGGVLDLNGAVPDIPTAASAESAGRFPNPPCSEKWRNPDWEKQNVVLCAGYPQVMKVLADWNISRRKSSFAASFPTRANLCHPAAGRQLHLPRRQISVQATRWHRGRAAAQLSRGVCGNQRRAAGLPGGRSISGRIPGGQGDSRQMQG